MCGKDVLNRNSHIEQEHPDYTDRAPMWRRYRHLYSGGDEFRKHAAEYLVRRHNEPLEIYQERLARVFYENYLGSIVDWYAATVVRREPNLEFSGTNESGKTYLARFTQNCNQQGTTLTQFFRELLTEAMVCGKSYVAVDFPKADTPALTRADEDALGRSSAYLISYSADELINWNYDDKGELEWVVIRTSWMKQESVRSLGWKREKRWIYYDREKYEIYERSGGEEKPIELVDQGRHGLSGIGRVPVFQLALGEGLWLTNKIALLQLEHFNKSNALGWALTMGLFAMPVIYSDREFKQITGESYYIQLGAGDRFGWTEPGGNVYQIAADNLTRLKDEIYRVSYLMQQASGTSGAPQSGLSQQWDFSITQEILRAYGDTLKDAMRDVLTAIAAARQDDLIVNVTGMDEFDISDFSTDVADAKNLLGLGIQSPTLTKQVQKRVAMKYLCDARQEIKNRIAEEIDAGLDEAGTQEENKK